MRHPKQHHVAAPAAETPAAPSTVQPALPLPPADVPTSRPPACTTPTWMLKLLAVCATMFAVTIAFDGYQFVNILSQFDVLKQRADAIHAYQQNVISNGVANAGEHSRTLLLEVLNAQSTANAGFTERLQVLADKLTAPVTYVTNSHTVFVTNIMRIASITNTVELTLPTISSYTPTCMCGIRCTLNAELWLRQAGRSYLIHFNDADAEVIHMTGHCNMYGARALIKVYDSID